MQFIILIVWYGIIHFYVHKLWHGNYRLILDFDCGEWFQYNKWTRISIKMRTEAHGYVHLRSAGNL